MATLREIKENYAKEKGFKDWNDRKESLRLLSVDAIENIFDDIAERYLKSNQNG